MSAKAVVLDRDRVLLGRNDRGEWELPGGRPERHESPEEAVVREVLEEAGLRVAAGRLLLSERFEVVPGRTVHIVAYRCRLLVDGPPRASDEHAEVRFVDRTNLARLPLPDVYRRAVAAA